MASPKNRFDVCAGRPYTTRDGEEKKHWINVGRMTEWDDGGFSIELHAIPTGNWFDGRLSCFEPKPLEGTGNGTPRQTAPRPTQRPQRQEPQRQAVDDFPDDAIPF